MSAGTSPVTAALAVRDALMANAVTAFNDQTVKVCIGNPGGNMPNDVVSFGQMATNDEIVSLGARRRRSTITVEVTFSVFRHGGHDVERAANSRAYALLGLLDRYQRVTDATLGGVALWCFLSSTVGAPELIEVSKGRTTEILATFTAQVDLFG